MKETSAETDHASARSTLLFPFRESQNQSSYAEEIDGEWEVRANTAPAAETAAEQ